MTIGKIIEAVRFCIDEEAQNGSNLAYANDKTRMDGIIKDKIGDALRWVCLNAPVELLSGTDTYNSSTPVPTGIIVDSTGTFTASGTTYKYIAMTGRSNGYGRIVTGSDFVRLARVRINGWHRAVINPFAEDSDEYLQLFDNYGATGTVDRPQAAMINKNIKEIEVWPVTENDTVEISYVANIPDSTINTSSDSNNVALPPNARTSFIYYLAFLLLSAYGDARAPRMLEIAKMSLSRQ